jgi:hypothetical protein
VPDIPSNILSQLVSVPHLPELKQVYLAATDTAPGEIVPWEEFGASEIAFQYWPETLTDNRETTWNPRYIPGGSHPIYQWTHGGERRLTFTGIFTTDTEPNLGEGAANPLAVASDASPYNAEAGNVGIASGLKLGTRDVDLRAVVSWLRYFTYPLYEGQTADDIRVFEPPKVLLVMPNSKLAHNGNDHITAIMTLCEVTYQEWFPNGFPRIIEVALEFAEVVQTNGRVRFHSRGEMGLMSEQVGSYLARRGQG